MIIALFPQRITTITNETPQGFLCFPDEGFLRRVKHNRRSKPNAHAHATTSNGRAAGHWYLMGR